MLCPAHSSVKFPNERSRSGKQSFKDHPLTTQQYEILESIFSVSYG